MTAEYDLLNEIQKRRLCRKSLSHWARHNGFIPARHHQLIIDKLEAMVANTSAKRKLMIFMPPGSAKSTYASVLFPPWYLAQTENKTILACSHSEDKIEEFGRKCRNIIAEHTNILGYTLAKDSQASTKWAISNGGSYYGTGVGAGISGRRADFGLIDDPIGKKQDAMSKSIRDQQWGWYDWDFKKRLQPNAFVVLIQTRWHEEDLAGQILAKEGDEWEVLSLPLIAELNDPLGRTIGEPLWPEYFDAALIGSRVRSSGYMAQEQQRPSPEDGDLFKKENIVQYTLDDLATVMRNGLRIFVGSDHAFKLKQENDNTCIIVAGVDSMSRLWILPNWFWGKEPTDVIVETMLSKAAQFKPIRWFTGGDHITGSIGPFLTKRMIERNVFFPLEELSNVKDKVAKAQSIIGRVAQKMVLFPPSSTPQWQEALHEMLTFPNGAHDDFVDALAELGRGLGDMTPMSVTPEVKRFDWNARFVPTMSWVKASHNRVVRESKRFAIDN